jgi:ubiquinone/menaquinone biosynthesis C-methylase UbiE
MQCMSNFSRYPISKCYNFIEKYIIKDYDIALLSINEQLKLGSKDLILDVGGGTGFILQNLYKKSFMKINMDSSKNMLLQLENETIIKIQGDGVYIPFKNESVTIVLLINVLHHIDKNNHKMLFQEICRILKKEGIFFMIDLYYSKSFFNNLFTIFEELSVEKNISHSSR